MRIKKISIKNDKIDIQCGATTILLSFLVMSIILIIALAAAGVVIFQIRMSKGIANSVPAFFGADAAAEKCLYQTRKLEPDSGDDCTKTGFTIQINLDNGAFGYAQRTESKKLQGWGNFGSTQRRAELNWQ